MRDYLVTATITYTARIKATSKDHAEEIALSLNGAHPLDIDDVHIVAVDPRSREGRALLASGSFGPSS